MPLIKIGQRDHLTQDESAIGAEAFFRGITAGLGMAAQEVSKHPGHHPVELIQNIISQYEANEGTLIEKFWEKFFKS